MRQAKQNETTDLSLLRHSDIQQEGGAMEDARIEAVHKALVSAEKEIGGVMRDWDEGASLKHKTAIKVAADHILAARCAVARVVTPF